MSIVYKATNKINDKGYVGFTNQSLEVRKAQHLRDAKSKRTTSPFHRALRKYAGDFKWEILKTEASLSDEIMLIKEHQTHKTQGGYNLTFGGDGLFGYSHTEETKQKMSKTRKGKSNPQTKEWSAAISASKKGKPAPWLLSSNADEIKSKIRHSKIGKKRDRTKLGSNWIVTFPDGHSEKISNLSLFCAEHNLNRKCLQQNRNNYHRGFYAKKDSNE